MCTENFFLLGISSHQIKTNPMPIPLQLYPVHAQLFSNYWEGWEWRAVSYRPLENSCCFLQNLFARLKSPEYLGFPLQCLAESLCLGNYI